jgi:hypothetical protein
MPVSIEVNVKNPEDDFLASSKTLLALSTSHPPQKRLTWFGQLHWWVPLGQL